MPAVRARVTGGAMISCVDDVYDCVDDVYDLTEQLWVNRW
jgi:hypothetical protein